MPSNYWDGKNVLITGGSGFLGSWICKELQEKGSNIIVLDKEINFEKRKVVDDLKKIESVTLDIRDYKKLNENLKRFGVEVCFHLAAQPIVTIANANPIPTLETNINGTWNILEFLRNTETIKSVVVASSDKAYGEQTDLPYNENCSLNALHPYDASKACTDIIARTFAKTYNMPVCVTRLSNIYGGGDFNFSRIIPGTIKSIIFDEPIIIRSDGTPKRDYIYISDAVSAYLTLAESIHTKRIKGEAFNFGLGKPFSVLEVTNMIIKLIGKDIRPQILGTSKNEIDVQYLSYEKALKMIEWSPKFDLREGLKLTINWYKNYFNKTS